MTMYDEAMYYEAIESPLGDILIAGTDEALTTLDFGDCRERMDDLLQSRFPGVKLEHKPGFGGFAGAIRAYFGGDLHALDAIEVRSGGTPFQQLVWTALRSVGPGRTATYSDIAKKLGKPGGSRAVGLANSKNPVALVVPCHRIIGADGKLTGYAGGLDRKQWLLRHEGALI